MKAVVLAAGEGSRMWPLAVNKPKHLLPVGDKPLISHILKAIKENLIEEVFVVVGFRGDLMRSALGNGSQFGLHIEYLDQPDWTGTASALEIAFDAVGHEPFLAVYGDLWITPSAIQRVIEKSRDCPRVMGVAHVTNPSEYGSVELDADRLVRIVEKPRTKAKPEGWVNTGIYVLDSEVFRAIKKTSVSKRAEFELTTSLQHVLDDGNEIKGAIIGSGDWMDVGRPWDLLEANERALANLSNRVKGSVEHEAVLKGSVWLEENSVVRSGCYIEGPVYIGRDSRVGPNARIRPHTCIQDRVVVGASCEIKNSIVMNGTRIPHLSYLGDSIIGENCNLGAGTITANIRFDEETLRMRVKGRLQDTGRNKIGAILGDEVQTGINVSILPGVRVGSGSWIGPGAIISEDVPSGQLLVAKQTYVRKRLKKRRAAAK
jgi:bifunctional UDP-N-acetylglucosamine pyrophosphorylase/glucosamine-1-phosphate N-acetyltransferase